MDVFLPYSRLVDRLAYQYKLSIKIYGIICRLMKWYEGGMKQFTGFHKHAKACEIEDKLGPNTYDSYYKFAFVRNPFDFIVSLYFYILQDTYHPSHEVAANMNLQEFLKWHLSTRPPLQLEYITDESKNKVIVDHIGRFETLAEDIVSILKALELKSVDEISHKNPSLRRKSRSYKEYYDDESRKLVEDYFREDLELFGYGFDGIRDDAPIIQQRR